jgi:hypothetical protein
MARVKRLQTLRWDVGAVLPPELKVRPCPHHALVLITALRLARNTLYVTRFGPAVVWLQVRGMFIFMDDVTSAPLRSSTHSSYAWIQLWALWQTVLFQLAHLARRFFI